jgi:large subunit ribosomal protein L17
MKKRKSGRIFSRKTSVRKAMLLSVTRALLQKERITTTEAKAKEVRALVEKLISKGRQDTLAQRRVVLRSLDRTTTKKLFSDISPRYKERTGGYTRIIKTVQRKSDGAKMAILELVQ